MIIEDEIKDKKVAEIEIKKLKKHFKNTKAVDGISFSVKKGEIFGFLGPNGAGKTTTIRCMMDFIRPTEGKILISNLNAQRNSVRVKEKVGFIAASPSLYDHWSGLTHIRLLKNLRGNGRKAKDLAKKLELDLKKPAGKLSTGNKQKLSLVIGLMGNPEILILDEPTMGLDPLLQNTIYKILMDLKKKGATIFMSSHNLAEVEKVCDRVTIIKKGKVVTTETIKDLKEKQLYTARVHFEESFDKKDFETENLTVEEELENGLILNVKGDINLVIDKLEKYRLKDLEIEHADLEQIFLEYYK